jgi:uncharacterized protein (TIGR03435 family)
MVRAIVSLAVCVSGAVYAQAAATLRFEVASVKPSKDDPGSSGIKTGHGRLDAKNVTLKRCIIGAYGVGPNQVSGGPDWLESDRFEISAKADTPTNDDAVLMVMLQDLLAERFKLVVHRETRTLRALVLEVARNGPKLEKAEAGEARTNTVSTNTGISIDSHNTDTDLFAQVLAREMDMPVVNHTELKGVFNFKLHWTPDKAKPADSGAIEGASIFTAIQEQLGLRLRAEKAPVEVLVIDHVDKPSEN